MIRVDKPLLDTFGSVEIRAEDLDLDGRFTRQLAALNGVMTYRLRGDSSLQLPNDQVLSVQALRREGTLRACYNSDLIGTDITLIGNGQPHLYCLMVMLSGAMELVKGPSGAATSQGTHGMIVQGLPGTRIQTTDNSARLVLWVDGGRLERALGALIGEPPRQSLAFSTSIDWTTGPTAAVQRLMMYLFDELRDPQGITTDAVARETFTELLLQTMLRRLEHNYTARLDRPVAAAIPRHLRRAEAFMHESADRPITLADVAAAAGCSLGTLQTAFHRFRDTTALRALHDIRLQSIRQALLTATESESTGAIARRFGFTNATRLIASYGRRFGERPSETRRSRHVSPEASGLP